MMEICLVIIGATVPAVVWLAYKVGRNEHAIEAVKNMVLTLLNIGGK